MLQLLFISGAAPPAAVVCSGQQQSAHAGHVLEDASRQTGQVCPQPNEDAAIGLWGSPAPIFSLTAVICQQLNVVVIYFRDTAHDTALAESSKQQYLSSLYCKTLSV